MAVLVKVSSIIRCDSCYPAKRLVPCLLHVPPGELPFSPVSGINASIRIPLFLPLPTSFLSSSSAVSTATRLPKFFRESSFKYTS